MLRSLLGKGTGGRRCACGGGNSLDVGHGLAACFVSLEDELQVFLFMPKRRNLLLQGAPSFLQAFGFLEEEQEISGIRS